MIKVKVKPSSITVKGHADYADMGKDIVCASVSSIVTTTINAVLSFENDAIDYKSSEGLVNIDILKKNETTKKLIQNMVNMLIELSNDYPKNIKVERE